MRDGHGIQCYQDYCLAYKKFLSTQSQVHLQEYYDAHNNYVQQLHATNGMIKLYQLEILPRLLEEVQESYLETSSTIASSIQSSSEMLAAKVCMTQSLVSALRAPDLLFIVFPFFFYPFVLNVHESLMRTLFMPFPPSLVLLAAAPVLFFFSSRRRDS